MSGRGVFITMEGIDRAGKSTQTKLLRAFLEKEGVRVVETREPGGTVLGEKLRDLILHGEELDGVTETLLMAAARREHVMRRILPALEEGKWVVCDRFSDSTFAYQGGGRGVCTQWIEEITRGVENGAPPDMTFYFPPPPVGGATNGGDIFERRGEEFYRAVAASYQKRAEDHPERITAVSTGNNGQWRAPEDIATEIKDAVKKKFGERLGA